MRQRSHTCGAPRTLRRHPALPAWTSSPCAISAQDEASLAKAKAKPYTSEGSDLTYEDVGPSFHWWKEHTDKQPYLPVSDPTSAMGPTLLYPHLDVAKAAWAIEGNWLRYLEPLTLNSRTRSRDSQPQD